MRLWSLLAIAPLLAACADIAPANEPFTAPEAISIIVEPTESEKLTAYLDAEFEEQLARSPQWLTRLGRKTRYSELNSVTEATLDENLAWRRESVAEMKALVDYDQLDAAAKTSYDIWALELARSEAARPWRRHRYVFARGGPHTRLPGFLINSHAVSTPLDMDAYISRIREIGRVMDEYLDRAKAAAADGIHMPGFAYDQSLSEARRVTAGAPFGPGDPSPVYADALAKIAALEMDEASADVYRGRVKAAMTENMAPAYARLIAWLEADSANASDDPQGAWALPDGKAYYDWRLENQTTTQMTADEIHQLGLKEVARIQAEMIAIKDTVGFEGSLKDFFNFMRTDPQFFLPNTDEGREEYLRQARDHIARVEQKVPDYFGLLPKAALEVRRVEPFREEAGGAAHYRTGSLDGSRPGVFYAHLIDMSAVSTFRAENLCYHEAIPGHHMQLSIAQEMTGMPVFRGQYKYTAYVEGWALYAEYLGKDMGGYADPYSDFGRLSGEIWRAVRLVVDTGLHAKGWTSDQAIAYALANSPRPESSVRSEVRRYLVNPAQATTYKIGMNHILDLRARAQAELGDTFTYAGFHDVVLGGGSVPLPILTRSVDAWIETVKTQG